MAQLLAGIWADPAVEDYRGAKRRTLSLALPASSASQPEASVVIRDLSELGFMIETTARLAVGETFEIDLPQAGLTEARVIWNRESYFGCKFLSRVSKGAVSAALLRTPIEQLVPAYTQPQTSMWTDLGDDNFLKDSSRNQMAAMTSMSILSVAAILFIFALLMLPFSAEQFAP